MERMQRVDFYEIVDADGNVLADVGIYGDEPSQGKADALAARMGATAHFDRTGVVYVE